MTILYTKNGLSIEASEKDGRPRIKFVFDREDAKGTLIVEEGPYGLLIFAPQVIETLALVDIDLFYGNHREDGKVPHFEVIVGNPLDLEDDVVDDRFRFNYHINEI